MSDPLPDLLALKPEPDRYVQCGGEDERPSPMFHLHTLLQFGERVAEEAVRRETERCASLAERMFNRAASGDEIAEAIRARNP